MASSPSSDDAPGRTLERTGLPPVRSVYQPIVDLYSGQVLAYEALARGPQASALESPMALFGHAREQGLEDVLDIECQAAAMRGALEHRLPASVPLFVNTEPRWMSVPWPEELRQTAATAARRLQMVIEITERSLVEDPTTLFAEVGRLRSIGCGIALDDVGAQPESLALMPFIDPDVIKLDLSLVQDPATPETAAVVNAVMAQAERTGALVLAEGVETEEHRLRAMAMGAHLAQGWLFGRPGELPERPVGSHSDLAFTRSPATIAETPFDAVARRRAPRAVSKGVLLPMSHHLESHALRTTVRPVLLSTFEDVHHFTPATAVRYAELSAHCSFVAALGAGLGAEPVPGVRGVALAPDDRLRGEWVVCVVGPHFAGALVAKDLGDTGPDRERRFDMVITHDRDLVIEVGRSLFARIGPAEAAGG